MNQADALIFLVRSAQAAAVGADAVRATYDATSSALAGEKEPRLVAIREAAAAAATAMHAAERAQMQFSALLAGEHRTDGANRTNEEDSK